MTLKVEMFNGKPDRMEMMGLDNDGELYVEKVVKVGEPNPDFRLFTCSSWDWLNFIELGKIMGWTPMGTVMEKTIDSNEPILSDYDPSTWMDDDFKVFLAEDAKELANSLEKSYSYISEPKSKVYGLINNVSIDIHEIKVLVNQLSITQLRNFIIFLRKGKFKFVYDD